MRVKHNPGALVEADMTPMIDIVFQLLTFFMIVSNFESTKADERVKLPTDMLARPPEVKPEEELVLNIGFHRNSDGTLADPTPYIFYSQEDVPIGKVSPRLEQERRFYLQKGGEERLKEVTVIIRADADVPTGLIQNLIKKCQEVGFEKFALKAKSEEDKS